MKYILLLIAILLSAFFSGVETVLLTASRIRIEVLFRRNVQGIKRVLSFIKKPETFIGTVLIGNNFSNVIFSSLIVLLLRESVADFFIIMISSSLLLTFGEIIPKSIGWEFANPLVIRGSQLLNFFRIIFFPLNFLLVHISNSLVRRFHISNEKKVEDILTHKDLVKLIHESEQHGVIETHEREIITRVFDLRHTRVKETMIPRTDIVAVENDTTIPELLERFNQIGLSRIPVFEGSIDHIVGVVYAKDLFLKPNELKQITEQILYVPETKNALELLQEFRDKNTSIAVVLDEYGGTAGLVTLEDLIEELFGEIYDEFDIDHEHMYIQVNERTINISARAEIDEINEKFELQIPEGDYTTLAGFIIEELGRIPKAGEKIELESCQIIIEKASLKRVILVKLIFREPILLKEGHRAHQAAPRSLRKT